MRKVLSFVLVLSLVLGSFSMAFAAPASGLSDIAGIANEEAIQVSYDLGIVTGNPDGTFLPTKAVNRAEFAAMITRALAIPDSALAGYTTSTFKDTVGYGWAVPYLAFCNSKGIMLGDGAGNAMPGRTINTNEAVTMVLRAIGYVSNSSELVGTWPSNYVTKAQELKLYDDVAKVVNVDKANAAQIIYNALTVQKVAVNSDGQTNVLWDDSAKTVPTTLLSAGLNCTSEKGVMGADFGDDAVINVQKHLGKYGTAYLNKDKEVVAFISDCTQLVGTFLDTNGFDDGFNTTDADVDYTNKTTTSGIAFFVNGDYQTTPLAAPDTDEYVIYADVSGKTIKQIYSVMVWSVTASDAVSASDIKNIDDDQSLLGVDFALDDDDEIDLSAFALVGVASLDDIKAGNVVYVYENDNNEISKIEVGTATVEGIVKSYKSTTNFTINGTTYKNASAIIRDLTGTDDVTSSNVSYNVKAKLDARGYVYEAEQTDNATNNIAVVMATGTSGLDNAVRLYTAEGSSKVFNTKDNATFTKVDNFKYDLIAYGLNKDGEISSVKENGDYIISQVVFDSNSVVSYEDGGTSYSAIVKSDVVVFTYDKGGINTAAAEYSLSSIDKIAKKDLTATNAGLLLDDTGKVTAVLIAKNDAKASSDDVYAVVNKEYLDTDADGDAVYFIEGFADGKAISKFTDSDTDQFGVGLKATALANVALYKIELDADGTVTGRTLVEDNGDDYVTTAAVEIGSADGRKSVTVTGSGVIYALSSDVVIYEVTKDGYKVYSGNLNAGWNVVLYNVDADDNNQYDVVFMKR